MPTGLRANKNRPDLPEKSEKDIETDKIQARRRRLGIIESIVHAYSLNLPEEEQRILISRLYAQKRECEAILNQ